MNALFILLLSLNSFAESSLQTMLRARSAHELEAGLKVDARQRLIREQCAAELKVRSIPRSCFEFAAASETARLARLCREAASKSRSRLDLSGENEKLPADCRSAINDRLEDLKYADEETNPELSVIRTAGTKLE